MSFPDRDFFYTKIAKVAKVARKKTRARRPGGTSEGVIERGGNRLT
jgi:hypothetical protein